MDVDWCGSTVIKVKRVPLESEKQNRKEYTENELLRT